MSNRHGSTATNQKVCCLTRRFRSKWLSRWELPGGGMLICGRGVLARFRTAARTDPKPALYAGSDQAARCAPCVKESRAGARQSSLTYSTSFI